MTLTVAELWRFPVKSLRGERLEHATVSPQGIEGDRAFGIVDDATGLVLTARREPALLHASAALAGVAADVAITLPDGSTARTDADLSDWLGRPVHLEAARPDIAGRFETQLDFEHEDVAEWFQWDGPLGAFHDSTRARVSLVSVPTMREWDRRRFRINVVLESDGENEDELVGRTVRVGDVELDVQKLIDRCVMVTRAQADGIERDLDVLRTIHRERAGNLGIGALVVTPGTIAAGDVLVA